MARTLLLDAAEWDLALDSAGNIAVAGEPYSLAQDAASAIKTFAGEVYWDTTLGIPYLTQVFGRRPSIAQLKSMFVNAAMSVPGVASARCFLTLADERRLTVQIQVTSAATGQVAAATFTVVNPEGSP